MLNETGSEDSNTKLENAIAVAEQQIGSHLGGVVRRTVEETLNRLLGAAADTLCGAGRYDRNDARPGRSTTRAAEEPTQWLGDLNKDSRPLFFPSHGISHWIRKFARRAKVIEKLPDLLIALGPPSHATIREKGNGWRCRDEVILPLCGAKLGNANSSRSLQRFGVRLEILLVGLLSWPGRRGGRADQRCHDRRSSANAVRVIRCPASPSDNH